MTMTLDGTLGITATGQSTIPTINLTGGQIAFPVTQSASADGNTLDDYEEGTWTPTIYGSSTAGTTTYNVQNGYYTKVGNLVTIKGYVFWTAGTGTGNMLLGGLPFASSSSSNSQGGLYYTYFQTITLTASNIPLALIQANRTYVDLYQTPVGGGGATAISFDGTGEFIVCGSYFV